MTRILLYSGEQWIVNKSGVGEALRHQRRILELAGVEVTEDVKDSYDVVQINTIFPGALFRSLRARRQKKKVIYYAHSTKEDFRNSFIGSNLFAGLFGRWLGICYNTADLVITPTPYSKELLKHPCYHLRKPVISMSNGIDTRFWCRDTEAGKAFRRRYGIKEGQKTVISVGHLIERKGILDFLAVAEELPEVEFFWFGKTSLKMIPKTVREGIKNAPANVHFPGFADKKQLKEAYNGADAFLFLTKEETEGIVLLEALSCEQKVLIRDIPIYKSMVPEGELIRKGSSREEFIKELQYLLSKTSQGNPQARALALMRDYQKIAEKMRKVYQRIFKNA